MTLKEKGKRRTFYINKTISDEYLGLKKRLNMNNKESIAETRSLKLVRTKLVNGSYFEIYTKRKNGYGVCCFQSRDEEEARKKFAKLKREMV